MRGFRHLRVRALDALPDRLVEGALVDLVLLAEALLGGGRCHRGVQRLRLAYDSVCATFPVAASTTCSDWTPCPSLETSSLVPSGLSAEVSGSRPSVTCRPAGVTR